MNQELQFVMDTLISEMGKMEARINGRMDERFNRNDKRFEEIDKRFEGIDERFKTIDKRLNRMDKRIGRTEKDIKLYVNMLVDEMGRIENKMEQRFKQVDMRLDAMQHEVYGCKLASETVSLLMQRMDQHESRIERLEKTSGMGSVIPI